MFRNFGLLTLEALSGPLSHVLTHGRPNYLGRDALSCPFHSWVSQSVEDVEDSFAGCEGNVGPGRAVADVNNEILRAYARGHKVEAASCVFS